jgi:hypothetical protein
MCGASDNRAAQMSLTLTLSRQAGEGTRRKGRTVHVLMEICFSRAISEKGNRFAEILRLQQLSLRMTDKDAARKTSRSGLC